ncbi:MAG TPA: hypothetical protein ENK59_07315 [Thioploca sp.]|nr:hypothetical protein [Thioploca sp.]
MTTKVVTTGGHNIIGGLSRVFHCNFYNAYLQMAVLMTQGTEKHDPEHLLIDSIANLINLLKQQGYSTDDLIQEFSQCGFGKLEQLDAKTWITSRSHYGEVLCMMGKPQINCYFTSGYLQGLLNKTVHETECKLLGAVADKFLVSEEEPQVENYLIHEFELQTNIPQRFTIDQSFNTNVDEDKIIAAVREMPLYGDAETGLIKAFGAVLTNHFADYYNRISYESYFALCKAGIPEEDSKEMFIQAGHICAFNTFGRIMQSPEWYNLVVPMCANKEDWLHGMIAVLNGFGWGVYRIEKIIAEKKFIVRVYNSYEGVGYRKMYSKSTDRNISFLAMGAVIGLIHLLWKVDIRDKPELTQEFYVEQFNHPANSYMIEQTHAIAADDEYDRFIVSK